MKIKKLFRTVTDWEQWHYQLKYVPLFPAWLWYCVKARSFWFFTPSNPTLTFGGFEGEGKMEMYRQLPSSTYPKTIYITPDTSMEEIESQLLVRDLDYPIAVKPDVGMMGYLFRKINNREELLRYHSTIPVNYLIQELVDYPMEVSVFYYRFPHRQKGVITGFLKKEMLEVRGDGKSTLDELLLQFETRPGFKPEEWRAKHAAKLDEVIPEGEIYKLSWVANLSRGGKLINMDHEKDDRLLKVFDELSHYAGQFYYGRYDIKCASIEALKRGEDFSILEFNGCGAEPNHIYGNGHSLLTAYRIVIQHWSVLYRISRYNHRQGLKYWRFLDGYRFLKNGKKHFRQLRELDLQMP